MDDRIPFRFRLLHFVMRMLHGAARVGRAVVWPFEWVCLVVLHACFRLVERIGNLEAALSRSGMFIHWHSRRLWNGLFTTPRLPGGILRALGACWHGLGWCGGWLLGVVVRVAERLNLDGLFFRVAYYSKPLWYPFAAVGSFIVAWAGTRPYRHLLWGLPALLITVPLCGVVAWGALFGRSNVATHYSLALSQAIEERDHGRVDLFERKLSALQMEVPKTRFNHALALEREGKLTEAYARMVSLAGPDRPGYPLAHIWIVEHLVDGRLGLPPEETHRLVGKHLEQLDALSIEGESIDMLRAAWLAKEGRLNEAAALLEEHVTKLPAAAIESFRIHVKLDENDLARRDANEVCAQMRKLGEKSAVLSNEDYETWAAAANLLQDQRTLNQVLREWYGKYPSSEGARKNIAALSAAEFNGLLRSPAPNPELLADRLRIVIECADVKQNMRGHVALLYKQRIARPEIAAMFDLLGKSTPMSSVLAETLGTAASANREWGKAQAYLQVAVDKDPKNAIAWNNLACVMIEQPNVPIDRAYAAVAKALELQPDDFNFRETRGEILLKLKRWQEAVDDLEYAVNGMPDSPAVHKSLYVAYEALGKKEMAALHQRQAD